MADQENPSGAAPLTATQPPGAPPAPAPAGWHTGAAQPTAGEHHGASASDPLGAPGVPEGPASGTPYAGPPPGAGQQGPSAPGTPLAPGTSFAPGTQYATAGASGPPGYGPPDPSAQQDPYAAGAYGPAAYALPAHYGPAYQHHGWAGQPYGWHYGPVPAPPRQRRTPEERRRLVRWGLVLAGIVLLALGAGIGIGAWIAPTTPVTAARALVSTTVQAATRAGSYHYSELSTLNGAPDNIVGDATGGGGRQVITQKAASGQTDVFDLRLVRGTVYFRGNEAAVADQLGVPPAKASADAGKWVSLHKGQGHYKTFAAGITTKSNISQLPTTFKARSSSAVAGSSPPTTRISGGLVLGKGAAPIGTAALVVVSSTSLPRSLSGEVTSSTARYTVDWTFSHFHEPVKVSAPSGALPYASLGATSGSTKG